MINSIGSSMASSWASKLFTQLDTKNQGYIEQSDLASAYSKISDDGSSVEEIFSQLDGDSDGKVTQDEMTSAIEQIAAELDQQFNHMRMHGGPGDAQGMPPPPPPPQNDSGFTEEELASQLEEIGSTDSQRSELISKVLENFDAADTDSDGKVSFKEAMALDQSSNSSSSDTASATETSSASDIQADVMKQIVQLMQAYQVFGQDEQQNGIYAALSVSA
jgi:Ca2+-binding EF-hand superfamily protein